MDKALPGSFSFFLWYALWLVFGGGLESMGIALNQRGIPIKSAGIPIKGETVLPASTKASLPPFPAP